jgi:hypothetical protein
MNPLRLLPFLLIAILLGLPTPSHAESEAPYIYYYSDLLKGWVIERADGTYIQEIGLGLNVSGETFTDVAFSPSGRWLAGRSGNWGAEGAPMGYDSGWAIRVDNRKRFVLPYGSRSVLALHWSPTEDLLFSIARTSIFDITFSIHDPETGGVVARTVANYSPTIYESYDQQSGQSGWLADGSGVYFYPYAGAGTGILMLLWIDGQIETRFFDGAGSQLGNITKGRLLFMQLDRPLLQDLTTQRTFQAFDSQARGEESIHQLFWNPTMSYGILGSQHCEYPYRCNPSLTLIDWESGQYTRLDESLTFSTALQFNDLLNHVLWGYRQYYNDLWSPDGRRAIVVDLNQPGQLYVIDTITDEVNALPHMTDIYTWQWAGNTGLVVQQFQDPSVWDIDSTYHIDLITGEVSEIDDYGRYQLSPTGHYLATPSGQVVDLQTRQSIAVPATIDGCNFGGQFQWNPEETWFFTFERITCKGGGYIGSIAIHSIDGSSHRRLTACWTIGTCANFLPERVRPHLPAASW